MRKRLQDRRTEIIRFLREDRKKKWIAEYLGVSRVALYKYLNKNPITDDELSDNKITEQEMKQSNKLAEKNTELPQVHQSDDINPDEAQEYLESLMGKLEAPKD
ncbi:MAG: hypothetical protein KGV46_02605 [Pasteurella sp.]|nr:hypothetical protein [Pasteurella sp.]